MGARISAIFLSSCVWALPLLAEEGHGEEAAHGAETFLGLPVWLWKSANLILFLGVLAYFIGPLLREFLEARGKAIREGLERAAQQRQEAESMRGELETRIADLEREMSEVLERSHTEAERERREILAQAERERERLLAQTDEEIRYKLQQARQDLTEHTARLAAELARKKLEGSLADDDLGRLFDENLARLERGLQ